LTLHSSQGGDKYQQAFYVFEELAQAPATSSIVTLVSQAVCELHLGRVEEAQSALEQALQKQPDYADAIANLLVLTVITGKDATELTRYADTTTYFHILYPLSPKRLLLGAVR
jgi:coatomer subunit epsilon